MKKNVLRILAAILALTMVFSLAACGNDDEKGAGSSSETSSQTSSSEDSSADSSSEESSEASTAGTSADGKFATVKAFLEDPETKAQLDASIEQMVGDDDTMEVSIDGTDDSLIYFFKFSEDAMATTDEEALKAALEAGMDDESMSAVFEGIASTVATVVEADNVKVVVVYAKPDGSDLVRREFTAG